MKHEILGEIHITPGECIEGKATIKHGSREIAVQIIPDDTDFVATLAVAAKIVVRLRELNDAAKKIAVADLLDQYNDGWNEYDQAQEDGSLKRVTNPELSEIEFAEKLTLKAVNVTGSELIDFFYDDCGMFWGHSVVVTSLNGMNLKDAYAELFG